MSQLTLEQAMEAVTLKKEAAKAAKAELKAFRKEHNLKPDDVPGEDKVVKAMNKLTKKLDAAQEELEAAQEAVKALKPATGRSSKYEFPEDCTTPADKKKYRAKMRREKKAAEKAANAPTEEVLPKKKFKKAEALAEDED